MAAQWMKQATAGFNPHALYLLGVMTARGIGVEKSAAEARALFVRAAELGSQDAIDALQSSRPALPAPYRRTAPAKTICSDINVVRQLGFPKPGQAEDFEDFRQKLRYDYICYAQLSSLTPFFYSQTALFLFRRRTTPIVEMAIATVIFIRRPNVMCRSFLSS
jgi:hypothetical protein